MAEQGGLSEAELDTLIAEDEEDGPADGGSGALDPATRELVEFVERGGRESVDEVPFDQLTPAQLSALGEVRFEQYLAWRDEGGRGVSTDEQEDDVEPARPIPDWASESLTPDAEWQKQAAKLYGVGLEDDPFASVYQGGES